MKLNVIFSTNDNPSYYQFWDTQHYIWSGLGARPLLLCVDNNGYVKDLPHQENIIEVPHEPSIDVPIAQLAQLVRLYYAPQTEERSMISDLDLFPLARDILDRVLPPQDSPSFFTPCYQHYNENGYRIPMQYFSFIGNILHQRLHQGSSFSDFVNKSKTAVGLDWNTDEMVISSFFQKNPELLSHSPSSKLLGLKSELRVEPWQIENFSFSRSRENTKIDIHFHTRNWPTLPRKIKEVRSLWAEQFLKP